MMKKILKFIYSKEDIGPKRIRTIMGIKITTSPYKLRLENKIDRMNLNLLKLEKRIHNIIISNNIHKQNFTKYFNIYNNKNLVLIATGPTLKDYINIPNAIHIGVNHAFKYEKIDLDFLFIQDKIALGIEALEESLHYRNNKCTKFYGISVDGCGDLTIPQYIYKNFRNAYIVNHHYSPFDSFTYDISTMPFPSFGSISFAALNFMAWTHPKRIFIVGCDCSSGGHFMDQNDTSHYGYMLRGWNQAKLFLEYNYPDIEIISINPVGLKGMFKDIYTKDGKYVDDNGNDFIIE